MSNHYFNRQLTLGRFAVLVYIFISFLIVIASEFIASDNSFWLSAREASTVVFMLLYIPIVIGLFRNWIWAWVWACLLMIIDLYSTALTHSEYILAGVIAILLILALIGLRACIKINQRNGVKRTILRSFLDIFGVLISAFLIGVLALAVTADKTTLQALGMQQGNALSTETRSELESVGILQPFESVELFFFCSSISFLDCGTILTDQRAISYKRIEDKRQVQSLPIESITDANLWEKGSLVTPSRVEVAGDGQRLVFFMTTKQNADERFVARLKQLIK